MKNVHEHERFIEILQSGDSQGLAAFDITGLPFKFQDLVQGVAQGGSNSLKFVVDNFSSIDTSNFLLEFIKAGNVELSKICIDHGASVTQITQSINFKKIPQESVGEMAMLLFDHYYKFGRIELMHVTPFIEPSKLEEMYDNFTGNPVVQTTFRRCLSLFASEQTKFLLDRGYKPNLKVLNDVIITADDAIFCLNNFSYVRDELVELVNNLCFLEKEDALIAVLTTHLDHFSINELHELWFTPDSDSITNSIIESFILMKELEDNTQVVMSEQKSEEFSLDSALTNSL
ncbi:MAG: hypothetical protein HAW67_03325 [Endozoicomonadaceae bacterium]|nr:hypothetical protein [Endozoicomonadaceae bacterium]